MTDLKSQTQIALQAAGYHTWLMGIDDLEVVGFEDDAVMGFACVFEVASDLLTRWREVETKLLAKHAPALQRAGEKAWNVYSVFLTSSTPDETQAREIRWIEENQERTRKLAAGNIVDSAKLTTALLPLLPLRHQPTLDRADFDVTERLTRRIAIIAPTTGSVVLDNRVSISDVILALGVEL